jgi:hypothetical protein
MQRKVRISDGTNTAFEGVARILLILIGSFVGFLLAEVGYRVYLYKTVPNRFLPLLERNQHPSFYYFQESPYRYSEEFGYEYVPGSYSGGYINNGMVKECYDPLWVNNERGNSGQIKGSYDNAAVKILVFGDSWTSQATGRDFLTWPDLLQDILEKQLGKSVHVVNFGRDGYGLLQMFDLAAAKIPVWKPDLAIIAFITDDLSRDRIWRMKTVLDGHERILTSIRPGENPDWETASELEIMNSHATREWCQTLRDSQEKGNKVVREMEEVALEASRRSNLLVDLFSVSQSFVLDLVLRGQPFYKYFTGVDPVLWPHHKMKGYAQDQRFIADLHKLDETGIPFVLVHLAYYPELKAEREYVSAIDFAQDQSLLESLGRLTGQPIYGTLDHIKFPIEDLESLSRDFPRNHHPSRRGAQFYAEIVAELLHRRGYVE